MAKPIPDGCSTITPYLVIKGAEEAIEYYKAVFDAREISRMPFPGEDGRMTVGHAELQIGDSKLFLADECPPHGAFGPRGGHSPVRIHLYVTDVDATFNRAVEGGGTADMPPADMFWGDRYGKLTDPFGHQWTISTHKEDVSPEQMRERMAAMFGAPCND